MIDLSNKSFQTRDDTESEKLLRIAVAQGYSLPKGLKALVGARYFKFVGFPYKSVAFPETANEEDLVMFADVFGDENEELKDILKRICKNLLRRNIENRDHIEKADESHDGRNREALRLSGRDSTVK